MIPVVIAVPVTFVEPVDSLLKIVCSNAFVPLSWSMYKLPTARFNPPPVLSKLYIAFSAVS